MKELKLAADQQKETVRIETFSDGVFCIAITLLTIEIGVEAKQDLDNKELGRELLQLWPLCLAYFISFTNILLAWIGHHSLFKQLRNTNISVMICNGFLLMLVALVPFPTKTLGVYLNTGAFRTAAIFYTGYFVMLSLAFKCLWFAASRHRTLLVVGITEAQVMKITRNENIGLIANLAIAVVTCFQPWLGLSLSFAMWIYWIVNE